MTIHATEPDASTDTGKKTLLVETELASIDWQLVDPDVRTAVQTMLTWELARGRPHKRFLYWFNWKIGRATVADLVKFSKTRRQNIHAALNEHEDRLRYLGLESVQGLTPSENSYNDILILSSRAIEILGRLRVQNRDAARAALLAGLLRPRAGLKNYGPRTLQEIAHWLVNEPLPAKPDYRFTMVKFMLEDAGRIGPLLGLGALTEEQCQGFVNVIHLALGDLKQGVGGRNTKRTRKQEFKPEPA